MTRTIAIARVRQRAGGRGRLRRPPPSRPGRPSGTTITNNVTLDYKVGGVDQNQRHRQRQLHRRPQGELDGRRGRLDHDQRLARRRRRR